MNLRAKIWKLLNDEREWGCLISQSIMIAQILNITYTFLIHEISSPNLYIYTLHHTHTYFVVE